MSKVSDSGSDTSNATLMNMTELSSTVPPIEPVVTPTPTPAPTVADKIGVKQMVDVVNVSRSGGEWVPISLNDMPIQSQSNTLNIINSTEMRATMTTMAGMTSSMTTGTTTTRTIAPKPITTSTLPIRSDTIAGTVGSNLDKTQTVIITTSSDSTVNSTISGNKYGINKVIPISSHIALVTSPDGTSMLAVPMSSLVTKGNVIKQSGTPVNISPANLKAKPPIITPLKILPLITSTTASSALSVPTLPKTTTVQKLIAPASVAINKAISNQSFTSANTGVTLIPTSIPKFVTSSESLPETTGASNVANNSSVEIKVENVLKEEVVVKTEDNLQSPLPPPLMAQNLTFATNCVTNPQTLTPPALTPVTTNLTISSNGNNTANTDQQNKNKGSESGSMTGIEEMDSIMMIMEWRDGIGTLPGSDLKFRIDEFGHLDMVQEYDLEVEASTTNGVKQEVNTSEKNSSQESDKTEVKDEAKESNESESLLKCINCGQRGAANTFLRQGRFCSKACATLVSTDLKLLTKRSTELSSLKAQEDEKKSEVNNSEVIKSRKQIIEPVVYQTENSNQTIEGDESTEDTNEEVEDVETNAGKFVENVVSMAFSWRQYLNKTNSTAAPVKCFTKSQTFPEMKNNFKVGMKLEGVDPQHPSKFCVLTVAEVLGHRIRLHFDGYKELFDFWVNYDNDFIFAAGFCEQTNRKLEPPVGISDDEFNWNQYLQQTRAVAAPKHLFSSSSSHQSLPPNGFQIGMKLEAVDRANTALVCVATIADIIDNWLLIHFDGWDDSYDYWAETTSPFIHPVNWCRTKGRSLTPPKDYYRSSEKFSWEEYLSESKSHAVSPRLFKTRSSNNFKVGLKLEAVDKRNPRLVRVCTVSHRQSHCIKLHFDGWDEKYDYWVDDDLPDIHPVNWCYKTGHPLQPPPPSDLKAIKERPEGMALCPTPGCLGMGHIRSCKYGNHSSVVSCPYTDSRLEYELPDRLGNRNTDGMATEDPDESQVSPSQSPSPSDSNSINSAQKSQKSVKSQQMCGTKAGRKRKLGSSPSNGANDANGANGPVSPSTNSESAKHSRPSTPSSITNLSSLQHSIFAMRMSQQQQEAPVCWDRHSKTTLPGIDKTKSKEVLSWTPTKVSDFIDQIPGCESVGQVFAEQLIDGEAFLLLNQNDIVKILNLKLGPAIKIFNSILVIRDNAINEDNV